VVEYADDSGCGGKLVPGDTVLETEDLTKDFAGFVAVQSVNLRVARGTIAMQNYLASFGQWVLVIERAIFVVCVLAFRRGIIGELGNALRVKL
jgi:hypothetical protein